MLHFLRVSIFGLFLTGIYVLNSVSAESITIKNDTQTMLERQEETLKWIQELKGSVLQSTEPYLETAHGLRTKSLIKTEGFQCGCGSFQNYFSDAAPIPAEDIADASSSVLPENAHRSAFYIFVSLSIPKPALIALNKEAARLGAALVLRGLKDNSYQKTAVYLKEVIEKTGQGFLVHPELFKCYEIHQVPSFALTTDTLGDTSLFDVVSGHIPIQTALLEIAEKGELKHEAKAWLLRGGYEN